MGASIYQGLALVPAKVFYDFQIWRLMSYGLLHSLSSPMHFIFNGLLLYFLGCELERRWGQKRFVSFILFSIAGGGLAVELSWLLGLGDANMVVGFSAATMAILVAWCIIYSYRTLYLFGIIALTGRQLLWITIGFEVLCAIAINETASAAHFGGMAVGAFLTTGAWRRLPMGR